MPRQPTTTRNHRTADHPIDPVFLDRWSPRTFIPEPLAGADLAILFEAARWAPSSGNAQPWRFLYAARDTSDWPLFLDLLNPGNRTWAADASVLLIAASKRTIPPKGDKPARPNRSHSFDTGAACACLALQAALLGLHAHAMAGFDEARALRDLSVPDDYRLEAIIAVGRCRADDPATASDRSPQASFIRAGRFSA